MTHNRDCLLLFMRRATVLAQNTKKRPFRLKESPFLVMEKCMKELNSILNDGDEERTNVEMWIASDV